jgi:hypothetical protein
MLTAISEAATLAALAALVWTPATPAAMGDAAWAAVVVALAVPLVRGLARKQA